MIIRCMITQKENVWVAMSLDFGLAAQADTENKVIEKLIEQIKEYVVEAATLDKSFQDKLLNRKAPASWFFIYYWLLLKNHIQHNSHNFLFSANTRDYISHA